MKSNAIIRIILYSILILLLTGILITCIALDGFSWIRHSGTSDTLSGSEVFTVPASQVQDLSIDWAAGSITIRADDVDEITIEETGTSDSRYRMACAQSGGELNISYGESNVFIGFGSIPEKDLTIIVPENWTVNELELDGAALKIDITGINVARLSLDGAAAELFFNGQLSELEVDGAACALNITCTNKPASIEIDGASCEVDLTLPEGCGFLVNTEGLGCSFTSNVEYTSTLNSYSHGDCYSKINVDGVSCRIAICTGSSTEQAPTIPAE